MTIDSLRLRLAALDQPTLYAPDNFRGRAAVLDTIAVEIIDEVDALLAYPSQPHRLRALRQEAEHVQQRLLAADETLFVELRACIRDGCCGASLWHRIEQLVGGPIAGDAGRTVVGYDYLDRLVTGILDSDILPEPQLEAEPEMVLYQRTPARIIFELVHRTKLGPHEYFYDIGSGMGHVPALVNLLSGAASCGVEVEPAFCGYAQTRAATLGLGHVAFLCADARHADYAPGTVFYMYTPFEGTMMAEVLERLRDRARSGPIRLATYGPCTAIVAQQDWLSAPLPAEPGNYRLALFRSRDG